jgi:hypothetical protein
VSDCLDLGSHHLFRPRDYLYRWVSDEHVVDGVIHETHWPTSQWKAGLSCDWSVLSGPVESAKRAKRLAGSLPAYVLRISIRDCTRFGIRVHHCPVVNEDAPNFNLAHCLLFPPDSGKGAIRRLREVLQEEGTLKLLRVDDRFLYKLSAGFRRWLPRHRKALRLIDDAIRTGAEAKGLS